MSVTDAEPGTTLKGRPGSGPRCFFVEGNRLELDLSDRAIAFLDGLLRDTGESPQDLIRKSLGLYRLAVDAWKEGKVVGSAPTADHLDAEFVND